MTPLGKAVLANWSYLQRTCRRGNFFVSTRRHGHVSKGVWHPAPGVVDALRRRSYVEPYGPKGSFRVTKEGLDWHDRYTMGLMEHHESFPR